MDSPREHAILVQVAPVPEYVEGYRMSIGVRAVGTDGNVYQMSYPFTVRNPLQVYYDPMRAAEFLKPELVSTCINGGPNGVVAEYSEAQGESRTRSLRYELTQGWVESSASYHSQTWGTYNSEGTRGVRYEIPVTDMTGSEYK